MQYTDLPIIQFEGLPANILGLPSVSTPPVPYKDLNFKNVVVAKNAPVQAITLFTPQGTQYAATNPGQFPIITTQYPDSKVASFDLNSLLTGCYLSTANGNAVPPVDCTLRFTGTKVSGPAVTQDFTFVTGALGGIALSAKPLQPVTFQSNFAGLISLSVQPIVSAGTVALTGVDLDKVTYNVRTTS
jgi:hypothetical protein